MILVRSPLRLSFVGGGTDLPDFYKTHSGRVISATIDKFVYVLINPIDFVDKFVVKYKKTEEASHPRHLNHTRIKAALLDLNLTKEGMEIGSFADIPARTGLGSSSSFSVALLHGLHTRTNKKLNPTEAAEKACNLEINLLKEPIGKQDQYAAALGGFNIIQFNPNESVDVQPISLEHGKQTSLERHLLLFYTGITREASSVLKEQKSNTQKKIETLKSMADTVPVFHDLLLNAEWSKAGTLLHEQWLQKRSLASKISNSLIDNLYQAALKTGAWGGKVAGAGGGGCLLLFVAPSKRKGVLKTLQGLARKNNLKEAKEIPFRFTQTGAEVLVNGDHTPTT